MATDQQNVTFVDKQFTQPYQIPEWSKIILWPISVFIAVEVAVLLSSFATNKKLWNPANVLVASLLASDFFNGVILLPIVLLYGLNHPLVNPTLMFVLSSSFLSVCACTYDRFIGVVFALHYNLYMTSRALKRILTIIWFIAAFFSTLPKLVGPSYENSFEFRRIYFSVILSAFTLLAVLLIIAYIRIFTCVLRQLRSTRKVPSHRHSKRIKLLKEDLKHAGNIFGITVNFFACWLPLIYINFVADVIQMPEQVPSFLLSVSLHTIFISSTVNPLLYGFRQKDIQKTLKESFKQALRLVWNNSKDSKEPRITSV